MRDDYYWIDYYEDRKWKAPDLPDTKGMFIVRACFKTDNYSGLCIVGEKTLRTGEGTPPKLLLKFLRTPDDKLLIPGSSIKGVLRHYLNGICGNNKYVDDLMGTMERISRVFVEDVVLEGEKIKEADIPILRSPRRGGENKIKFYGKRRVNFGANKQLLEIWSGEFKVTVRIFPGNEHDVGAVLLSMGLFPDKNKQYKILPIYMGYGKPLLYGKVRLVDGEKSISVIKIENLLGACKEEKLNKSPIEFVRDFVNSRNLNVDRFYNILTGR